MFCFEIFKDPDLSWNTENPTLTSCFIHTALVWPPAIFLWILFPYTFYDYLHSRRTPIEYNCRILIKLVLAFVLLVNSFVRFLAILIWVERAVSKSETIAGGILIATYLLLNFYLFFQRVFGFNNNGAVWFFLLFKIVTTALSLPVHIQLIEEKYNIHQSIELVCLVLLFIACCFQDNPRLAEQYENDEDFFQASLDNGGHCNDVNSLIRLKNRKKIKVCPKETSSFLSKLTFFWFDSMAFKGFRRPLTLKDLWDIRGEDKSSYLFTKFNRYWRHHAFEEPTKVSGRRNSVFSRSKRADTDASNQSTSVRPKKQPKTNVFAILGKTFWFYFIFPNAARFFTDLLQLANPTVLK